jgi:hypothetical protein
MFWVFRCIPKNTPFFIATNTEMEAFMELELLFEGRHITSLPEDIEAMLREEGARAFDGKPALPALDPGRRTFFERNNWVGSRIRQSGTVANDLYTKSRWLYGGFWQGTAQHEPEIKAKKAGKSRAGKSPSGGGDGGGSGSSKDAKRKKRRQNPNAQVIGSSNKAVGDGKGATKIKVRRRQ